MFATAALVALSVLAAALLRGFTGFGFALAAVPLLSLTLPLTRAVPLVIVLQAIVGFTGVRSAWGLCDWRATRWIIAGLVPGTPVGIWLLTGMSPDRVRLTIGLLIAASVVLLSAGLRLSARPPNALTWVVGAAAGVVNGLAAMPGPPIVAFFLAMPRPAVELRASIIIVFAATAVAGLVPLLLRGLVDRETVQLAALALPALLIGSRLGAAGFRRTDQKWHRPVALVVLSALSVMLIGRALAG
jgi:uncharacterized membrane protein YfcA